jgi:FixJ family two-component response regulator
MTGLQLSQIIKTQWPHLPVIIATGYAELPPGSPTDLLMLAKPFTERDLAKHIAKVMQQTAASPIAGRM